MFQTKVTVWGTSDKNSEDETAVMKLQLKTIWCSIYDHETSERTERVLDTEVMGGRIVQGWFEMYLKRIDPFYTKKKKSVACLSPVLAE